MIWFAGLLVLCCGPIFEETLFTASKIIYYVQELLQKVISRTVFFLYLFCKNQFVVSWSSLFLQHWLCAEFFVFATLITCAEMLMQCRGKILSQGITRLERWQRAHNHGLNPPTEVKNIISKHPNDETYTQRWAVHTQTHLCVYVVMCKYMHTYTDTFMYTHSCTHVYTHTPTCNPPPSPTPTPSNTHTHKNKHTVLTHRCTFILFQQIQPCTWRKHPHISVLIKCLHLT